MVDHLINEFYNRFESIDYLRIVPLIILSDNTLVQSFAVMVKHNLNSEFFFIEVVREFYTMEVNEGWMRKFLSLNQVIKSLHFESKSFPGEFFTLALEDKAVGSIF